MFKGASKPATAAAEGAVCKIASKTLLNEGDALLAVVKDGKILAKTTDIELSHARFVEKALGSLPEGSQVVTIGKLDGEIAVLNPRTFHGNQLPAPKAVWDAVTAVLK